MMQPVYNSFYVPEVWEKTPYGGERTTSLLGKLLKERIILLGTADRRARRQPDHGAAAPPRERGPGQGHLALHQLARVARSPACSRSTTR